MPVPMVIGLVVHASHRGLFEDAARTLTGVALEWVVYEHEGQIRAGVRALLERRTVDGLLLGPVPYARCRDVLPDGLTVAITRSAGLDLALAWCRALIRGLPATPVSIDTFTQETVDDVAHALGLNRADVACLPFEPEQSVEEIVEFHRAFRARSGSAYTISVRTGVMAALDGELPVLSGITGLATLRAELHELALRIQSKRASELRFAAGVFLIANHSPNLDRARIGLMNLLLNTPELADGWIENRDRRGVVVFAHRALFETLTGNWVSLPVLARAQETLGVRVVAGFGVGASARTCVALAERAAARAEQDGSPVAYLVEDSGVVIGPMGSAGTPLTFTYRGHSDGLESLARGIGLSPATLSRLAALDRTLNGRPISPSDLASSLGITDPSGRRLIRKLGEHNLVTAEGSAQATPKGRPTTLYRLTINEAMATDGE
ncbi:transcriptional regulator [Dactylosporangium sp. NPDC049742]|uniref:transcriptional regulator n=1 Tax=unclassified Dactylosporangium TaxID=2621675 RepID=UPI0033BF0B3C